MVEVFCSKTHGKFKTPENQTKKPSDKINPLYDSFPSPPPPYRHAEAIQLRVQLRDAKRFRVGLYLHGDDHARSQERNLKKKLLIFYGGFWIIF
jgi:hypothetical protein